MSDESPKPTGNFWTDLGERQQSLVEALRQRSDHPVLLKLEAELRQRLVRAALEMPEVLALIAAARACVHKSRSSVGADGNTYTLYYPPGPIEIRALDDALTALEARAR